MTPIVRVSILRCPPGRFADMSALMAALEPALRPGIEAMPGLLAYYAGADEATASLHNTRDRCETPRSVIPCWPRSMGGEDAAR